MKKDYSDIEMIWTKDGLLVEDYFSQTSPFELIFPIKPIQTETVIIEQQLEQPISKHETEKEIIPEPKPIRNSKKWLLGLGLTSLAIGSGAYIISKNLYMNNGLDISNYLGNSPYTWCSALNKNNYQNYENLCTIPNDLNSKSYAMFMRDKVDTNQTIQQYLALKNPKNRPQLDVMELQQQADLLYKTIENGLPINIIQAKQLLQQIIELKTKNDEIMLSVQQEQALVTDGNIATDGQKQAVSTQVKKQVNQAINQTPPESLSLPKPTPIKKPIQNPPNYQTKPTPPVSEMAKHRPPQPTSVYPQQTQPQQIVEYVVVEEPPQTQIQEKQQPQSWGIRSALKRQKLSQAEEPIENNKTEKSIEKVEVEKEEQEIKQKKSRYYSNKQLKRQQEIEEDLTYSDDISDAFE